MGAAAVEHLAASPLRAIGADHIKPIGQLGVAAMRPDQAGENILALTRTLGALHAQHGQLGLKVTEDDCAIAGHLCFATPDPGLSLAS